MKIFYAIQATGNGHISRAIQLYPYLQKFGEVDLGVACWLPGASFWLQGAKCHPPVIRPKKTARNEFY